MHRIQGGTGSLRVRVCGVMALAIGTAIGLATAALWSPAQAQQDYPARSVRMVIGFPPGQATDVLGRAVALKFQEAWGQQFFVDNKPGAAGIIGTTGYECWKDPQFVREFARDNPAARVRCHGTRIQVQGGFTANVRSRQSYGA